MTTSRRLAPLPLLASLLRTPRRLTSSRFSPSGKSLPSSPLVLTASRRIAPKLLLLLIGLAVLLALLPTSSSVQAQTPPNQSATGRPVVLAAAQGAGILFADTENIDDGNGLPITIVSSYANFNWSYRWIRVDGDSETNVGADSATYQPVEADVGKLIKVRVLFMDGDRYSEARTSLPFGPITNRPRRCPHRRWSATRASRRPRRTSPSGTPWASGWGITARATKSPASPSTSPRPRPV